MSHFKMENLPCCRLTMTSLYVWKVTLHLVLVYQFFTCGIKGQNFGGTDPGNFLTDMNEWLRNLGASTGDNDPPPNQRFSPTPRPPSPTPQPPLPTTNLARLTRAAETLISRNVGLYVLLVRSLLARLAPLQLKAQFS